MHQRVLLYIVGRGPSEHIGDIVIERSEVISMSAWAALVASVLCTMRWRAACTNNIYGFDEPFRCLVTLGVMRKLGI